MNRRRLFTFVEGQPDDAPATEKGRQLVADTVTTARDGHVRRLQQGICTVDAGVIFFDILSHIETVLDFVRDIERSVLAA